jgi:hypothetical protein
VTSQTPEEQYAAAAARYAAQAEEYGEWVCGSQGIQVPPGSGIFAFQPGDAVPKEHVARFGWDRLDPPLVIRRSEAGSDPSMQGLVSVVPTGPTPEAILEALTAPEEKKTQKSKPTTEES